MPAYRPWRYAPREEVRKLKADAFRNNSTIVSESATPRPENPLDAYRGSGGATTPLARSTPRKQGGSPLGKLGGFVKDVGEEALDAGKTVGGKTLAALDIPAQYTLRPLVGSLAYLDAPEGVDPATGQRYRTTPSWSDVGSSIKEAVTQNPIDTYREGKQAFEERARDPKLTAGGRVLLAGSTDPLNLIGPGAVGKVLTKAPAGVRAARATRAAATVLEAPRAVSVGGVAGSALAAEGAERAGLGPTGQTVATIAGGLAGGIGASLGSRVRPPGGLDFEDVNPKRAGKETTVKGKQEYKFRYRLVDLDELTVSHDPWSFEENPTYAQAIQPRDRGALAGRTQVEGMALDLDPQRLLADSADLQNGVPIVGPDGLVESGNGRTMATIRAAKDNPKGYAAYVKALSDKLPELGIDEGELAGIQRPYLVRERLTEVDRPAFADEANGASTLRMGTVETAKSDARRIPDELLHNLEIPEGATLDTFLSSPRASEFLRSFMGNLSDNERSALMDAKGVLNAAGAERLKAAFFAKTYQGPVGERLLADFFESPDPAVRNVRNGMEASLPAVSRLEAGVRAGTVSPDLALADDVAAAADAFARLKTGGLKFKTVDDYLAQSSMFADEMDLSPNAKEILRFMNDNAKSGKQIREALRNYANDALALPPPNQADLFGGTGPGQGFREVWQRATGRVMPAEEANQAGLDMGSGSVNMGGASAAPDVSPAPEPTSSASGRKRPSKVVSAPEPSTSASDTSTPQTSPGGVEEPAASSALIKVENESNPNASSERATNADASRDASSGMDESVPPPEEPAGPPPPLTGKGDYEALGLDPKGSYTADELKSAYRAQSRRYHPDVNGSATASEDMKRINQAYDRMRGKQEAGPRPGRPGAQYQQRDDWKRAWDQAQQKARRERSEFDRERAEYMKAREGKVGEGTPGRPTGGVGGVAGEPPLIPPERPPTPPPAAPSGKGGTQKFGAEEPVDLFKIPTRAKTISAAQAAQQLPANKLGNKLKALLGQLSGEELSSRETIHTKVDPFLKQHREVLAKIDSLTEVFGTSERMAFAKSGLEKVENADGTWRLFADGQDVGIYHDVIEGTSDAGKAARAKLSDVQNSAIDFIKRNDDQLNANTRFHGGDPRVDESITGSYLGRRISSRVVETEGGTKTIKRATGTSQSSKVGAVRDKSRVIESAERLQELGFRLEDPDVARMAVIRGKLLTAADAALGKRLKPLAVDKPGSTFGLGNVPGHPAFNNTWFEDPKVAQRIAKVLEPPHAGPVLSMVNEINNWLTPIRASFDFSGTLQQGMPMWLTNPAKAAEFQSAIFRSLKDDSLWDDVLLKLNAQGPGLEYLASTNLRVTGELAREEFALSAGLAQKLRNASGPLKPLGKVLDTGFEATNKHFGRTLNAYRIEFANNAWNRFKALGLEGEELDQAMMASNNGINRMFGWTATKPTTLESSALFAPRYFRAAVETGIKAIEGTIKLGHAPIEAAMARNHMARLLAEGAGMVFILNTLRGKETEWDPTDSNFLRIRDVGGVDISLFGTYNTLFRAIANSAKSVSEGDPGAAIGRPGDTEGGSLWRFAEGKMSPGLKLLYEPFISRQTYLGEPLNPLGSKEGALRTFQEEFKSTVPFGVQNFIEEGPVAAAVGTTGLSNTPLTPAEKRDEARAKHAKKMFGADYDSLTGAQKAQVNELPDVAGPQEKVDERSLRNSGDSGRATQIRKQVETELGAAMADLERGTDESGNPFSGNDFRKAYNDTMLRAAGGRALLKFEGGDAAVNGWFNLYKQATMANGQVDYDKLERLQSVYRGANPGIDEKVDKAVGIRDNPAVRELREAKKLAATYYKLPAYRGMTTEDSEHAQTVISEANDMVSFGQARNRADALRILAARDSEGARLARRATNAGPNPAREQFRKGNALFAKYYSDIAPTLIK